MKVCSIDDCGEPLHARGLCNFHYRYIKKQQDKLAEQVCKINGCIYNGVEGDSRPPHAGVDRNEL